jgi:ATP-dependent helicase/nuclease subunit A
LRRAAEELEAEKVFVPRFPLAAKPDATLSATDVGNAHHKFLQHVALALADNAESLRAEAGRLQRENMLTADETAALDFTALAGFWRSTIGEKIRAQAANVKRELAFTARFAPDELDEIIGRPPPRKPVDEYVIVQGVADLVVLLPEEIWLLDFKTDDVTKSGVKAKHIHYAPQLRLYALALERIYNRRVAERWLHFLACGETISVNPVPR